MDGRELKQYNAWRDEAHRLRDENRHQRLDLMAAVPQMYRDGNRIGVLEEQTQRLLKENTLLKRRVKELTAQLNARPRTDPATPACPPPFVKPNTPPGRKGRPGRKTGHAAALRPMPSQIDAHIDAPSLATDGRTGGVCCPQCQTQLNDVRRHERLVEDIIPSKVIVTCYHTTSGYCPYCRKQVESRAPEQPPAADLPHAQLGINALATAAMLRVCYRLPLRQITRLFEQLKQLKMCAGGIVKQLRRLSKWVAAQYEQIQLALRVASVVHADETGWRTNGRNGYLWTLTNTDHTLYHVNRSRGAAVILDLLGKSFGHVGNGKLVSDFYGVYAQIGGTQQRCLSHLLRELRDTIARRPELAQHPFFIRCKALVQAMLRLKRKRKRMRKKDYLHQVNLLEARLKTLSESTWDDADPDAMRLTARLARHRERLTTFLHHSDVDATNNAAERALRPAVVMRKITGGSRSAESANAWAILASVIRTAEQQGRDVFETIKTLLIAQWSGREVPNLLIARS